MRVSFGAFVLDRGTRQLRRGEQVRPLGGKAFELLDLLLAHRPNVVSRARIRSRLWADAYVSDSTLAGVVAEVRSALGDDPKAPRFLRTVYGTGYAFCGEARQSGSESPRTDPVAYRLLLEGREVALRAGENLLGRLQDGVAWIEGATVSRRHARILVEGGSAVIEDLGSKNGTFVKGQRISSRTPLENGDEIRLGRVSMRLKSIRPDGTTRSGGD